MVVSYLRRLQQGSVANEVEIEQIVSKEVPEGKKIISVVQVRSSIPLFWSQETYVFNPQPDIILNNNDGDYLATRLHFDDHETEIWEADNHHESSKSDKNHRESILRAEFGKAIWFINRNTKNENRLKRS